MKLSGALALALVGSLMSSVVARAPLRDIVSISSANGAVDVHLTLDVHEHTLDGGITFRTRAYNGQIPGPTVRVSPGDTMNIHIHNNLKETKRFSKSRAEAFYHYSSSTKAMLSQETDPNPNSELTTTLRACNREESGVVHASQLHRLAWIAVPVGKHDQLA